MFPKMAIKTYLWTEIHDPVELYNQAGLALLETKVAVLLARAGSQQGLGETTGLPDTHIALQFTPVLVFCRLNWREEKNDLA